MNRLKLLKAPVLTLVMVWWPAAVFGQESAVIELSDTVTGNQEQPQVLYIVPWQSADDTSIIFHPVHTKLGRDVFKHVERPEHIRTLEYLKQLHQTQQSAATP